MEQLTRWIPEHWRESLSHLREEIHGIVKRWLPTQPNGSLPRYDHVSKRYDGLQREDTSWAPSWAITRRPGLDVEETDDEVVVLAALPGFDPHDFAVEITGERLMLRAEKQHETNRTGRGYTYSQRQYGAFAQALRLPCEVDPDKAQAKYTHGVLRVTMPKTARARARRVQIAVQK